MRRVRPVPLYRPAAPPSRAAGAGRPRARRRPRRRPRGRVRGDRSSRAQQAAARNDDRRRGRGRIDGERGAGRRGQGGRRAPRSPHSPRRGGRRSRRDERPRASRTTARRGRRRRGGPRGVARPGARPRGAPARQAGGARLSPRAGRGGDARRPARRPVRRPVARRPGRCRGRVDPRRRGASRDRRRPEGPAPVVAHSSDEGPTPNRHRPPRRVVGGGDRGGEPCGGAPRRSATRPVPRHRRDPHAAAAPVARPYRARGRRSRGVTRAEGPRRVSPCQARALRGRAARRLVRGEERPASASSRRVRAGRWTSSGSGARSYRTWRPRPISRGSHPRRPP